jgi:hypothetical protein
MKSRHTTLPTHRSSWRHLAWPLYLQRLIHSDWPILVGPWRGEVGFEVLYWIPFLDHLKALGLAAERLIPITRGGAGSWYACPQGIELYAMRTPQQVRIENHVQADRTGLQKQVTVTAFDRQVLRDAVDTLKLGRKYHVLHPAWMFHLLAPFWTGWRGTTWLGARTVYSRLSIPSLPDGLVLPEVFVAARFYSRETWPYPDKAAKQATAAVLLKLADQSPVVVLDSPFATDDHLDCPVPDHPNLLRLSRLWPLTVETNLLVQSAVLAHAQGFIGTYGGMSQLALRLGKSSMSFFTEWGGTAITHRQLSEQIALRHHLSFHVVRLGEIPMMQSVLPDTTIILPGPKLDTSLTPAGTGVS